MSKSSSITQTREPRQSPRRPHQHTRHSQAQIQRFPPELHFQGHVVVLLIVVLIDINAHDVIGHALSKLHRRHNPVLYKAAAAVSSPGGALLQQGKRGDHRGKRGSAWDAACRQLYWGERYFERFDPE